MTIGAWLTVCTLIATLGLGAITWFSGAKEDRIKLIEQQLEECKEKHHRCEADLASIRGEIAWMRANMVFRMGAVRPPRGAAEEGGA